MADTFQTPSALVQGAQNMTFRLCDMNGRAPRLSATIAPATTLCTMVVPNSGRIAGFRMRALESGTTSSTTYNTVALYKLPAASVTISAALAFLRTNRGLNGASTSTRPTGASLLVSAGDVLIIRRLTKLNTASQLMVSCEVDREVT